MAASKGGEGVTAGMWRGQPAPTRRGLASRLCGTGVLPTPSCTLPAFSARADAGEGGPYDILS